MNDFPIISFSRFESCVELHSRHKKKIAAFCLLGT